MNFERIQGGSFEGLDTHMGHYYEMGFHYMVSGTMDYWKGKRNITIVDPFARDCEWGTITNDIDPNTKAMHNMDALVFLESLDSRSADYVLFDPPFSARQATRYEAGHVNIYTDPAYVSRCFRQIVRILKPSGCVLKLGYNSSRNNRSLELVKGWIVNFGASRNDVIMTIWEMQQMTLGDYK